MKTKESNHNFKKTSTPTESEQKGSPAIPKIDS